MPRPLFPLTRRFFSSIRTNTHVPIIPALEKHNKQNVVLMGPPGSGKTSVGKYLSQRLNEQTESVQWKSYDIDDDHLEPIWKCSVADKLSELGDEGFLSAEGEALLQLDIDGIHEHVISLSGSNPLHKESMNHVRTNGLIIFLNVSTELILKRCHEMKVDRIVGQASQSLESILKYREGFYHEFADYSVDVTKSDETIEMIGDSVFDILFGEKDKKGFSTLSNKPSSCLRGFETHEETETYPLTDIIYSTQSGKLLEIQHDIQSLQQTSADEWKKLFSSRRSSFRMNDPFSSSGVWNKLEWVAPHISPEHIVSQGEGFSHLMDLPQLANLFNVGSLAIKQCGVSSTGSFKDLGMTVLVSHVKHIVSQSPDSIRAIGCASTGDTSAALAAYAAYAGIPSVVFLPEGKITLAQLVQPIACGSIVIALDTDFDGCMKVITDVVEEFPIYLANSKNPFRIEGQKTVGIEIIEQMGWDVPEWIILPGGNLGNTYALYKGLEMARQLGLISNLPRIAVAQSENANPLYQSYQTNYSEFHPVQAKPTVASAIQIGNPVSYPRAKRALEETNGVVEQVSEQEILDVMAQSDRMGLFSCPHTGTALAATMKLREKNVVGANDRVVVISTAHGLKFTDSKIKYHATEIEDVESKYANPVRYCSDRIGDVVDLLRSELFE